MKSSHFLSFFLWVGNPELFSQDPVLQDLVVNCTHLVVPYQVRETAGSCGFHQVQVCSLAFILSLSSLHTVTIRNPQL